MDVDWPALCAELALGAPLSPPTPVTGGMSHRMWRLQSETGVYAVKVMTDLGRRASYRTWLERACQLEQLVLEAGVHVPRPRHSVRTGAPFVALAEATWARVHDWVDAAPVPEGPVDLEVATRVGDALARTHHVGAALADPATEVRPASAGTPWEELARAYPRLHGALALLRRVEAWTATVAREEGVPVLAHGDIDQKNLLLTADGRVFIVDWDLAGTMPAEAELAAVAYDLAGWKTGPPSRAVVEAVLAAYGRADGPAGAVSVEHLATTVTLQLAWVRFNAERAGGWYGEEHQAPGVRIAPVALDQMAFMMKAIEETSQ